MAKRSRKEKRQAVEKQRLRDEADAKRAKGSPSALSPSHLPEVALDLHVVFGSADDVSSGDEPMGDHDHTADAASAPPGELSRVLLAIVTRDPLFFLVVSLSH